MAEKVMTARDVLQEAYDLMLFTLADIGSGADPLQTKERATETVAKVHMMWISFDAECKAQLERMAQVKASKP